jgi:hypothetical protein
MKDRFAFKKFIIDGKNIFKLLINEIEKGIKNTENTPKSNNKVLHSKQIANKPKSRTILDVMT